MEMGVESITKRVSSTSCPVVLVDIFDKKKRRLFPFQINFIFIFCPC